MKIEIDLTDPECCDGCPLLVIQDSNGIHCAACVFFREFVTQSTTPISNEIPRLKECIDKHGT